MGFLDKIKNTFNSSNNFRYLDNLIHSGVKEIILDSDISLEDNEKTEYLDGIELDVDDLIIDGNGHRIDARIKTRIFHCSGNNVTIKNITLTNGITHENGGAIYNESKELYIFNSALVENIANKYGGAICNEGTIRIQNLSFKKNHAGSSNDIQNNNQLIIKRTLSSDRRKSITNDNHCFIESRKFLENIESFGKIFDIESLEDNQRDFSYLNNLIHSGTNEIKLENDIRLNIENNEDCLYKYGININQDNLIIDGNGHTIDAQKLGRIFHSTGKNITLKNIKFINGFLDGDGGALGNSGELTIIGCTFYANTVKSLTPRTISPANGGAISNSGKIIIIDSTFNKYTADIGGAAVNNRDGVLNISKSKFFDNTAKESAGAINNGINAELNINQSQIFKNSASLDGGAVKNGFGKLSITESKMYDNIAHKAGAIFNNFGVLVVTESRLFNNSADYGGAIVNYRSELTIAESGICGNTALNSGTIINDEGNFKIISCEIMQNESPDNIILNKDFLQINDSSFKANQSNQIILNDGDESDLSIFHGNFIKNQSKESVIDNNGKSLTVEKTLFDNNDSYNIINKNELTLINPKIKEESKTILNNGYIFMKHSIQTKVKT
ncbi:pectate lyase-like adhesive domain-containing protein [Methanobrevibacter sp.]|uniref:pectate lyase-like adhesive domain-containing protein n=1 Tax=Methanobrevibacter sp. TaxID=66852 RepID=UPI00388DD3D4